MCVNTNVTYVYKVICDKWQQPHHKYLLQKNMAINHRIRDKISQVENNYIKNKSVENIRYKKIYKKNICLKNFLENNPRQMKMCGKKFALKTSVRKITRNLNHFVENHILQKQMCGKTSASK